MVEIELIYSTMETWSEMSILLVNIQNLYSTDIQRHAKKGPTSLLLSFEAQDNKTKDKQKHTNNSQTPSAPDISDWTWWMLSVLIFCRHASDNLFRKSGYTEHSPWQQQVTSSLFFLPLLSWKWTDGDSSNNQSHSVSIWVFPPDQHTIHSEISHTESLLNPTAWSQLT